MEDDVDALHDLGEQRAIPDVALDDGHRTVRHGPFQILAAAADEIVEDHDLARPLVDEPIGDMRADEPGAARNQYSLVVQHVDVAFS